MKEYLSDVITDYMSWRRGQAYFISAQTGSGKTYFVLEKLLKIAVEQNKYIIYLCNRKSLQNQMKKLMEPNINYNITDRERDYILFLTYQYCESNNQFPNFKINEEPPRMTKADRIRLLRTPDKYIFNVREEDILYYVFDEAHYFISDSIFNSNINYWDFGKLIRSGSISVFLTATPEPLFGYVIDYCMRSIYTSKSTLRLDAPPVPTSSIVDIQKLMMEDVLRYVKLMDIIRRNTREQLELTTSLIELIKLQEKYKEFNVLDLSDQAVSIKFRSAKEIAQRVSSCGYPFELGMSFIKYSHQYCQEHHYLGDNRCRIYEFDNDYSYIDPIYFEEYEELIDDIVASDKQWMIFVETTKSGQALAAKLNDKNCKSVFVSAATRNQIKGGVKDTLLEIAERETFSCKVLITTSVLDCGINVKNSNLTNIVIAQSDKVEFLQMIGRVRVLENQRINLYIKAFSQQRIQQLVNQLEHRLRWMLYMLEGDICLEKMSEDERKFVSKLVYKVENSDEIEYKVSNSAYIYCLYSLYEYIEAQRDVNGVVSLDFYIRRQLKWLGKKYDGSRWYKYQEKMQRVKNVVEEARSQGPLDVEAQNVFCKSFIDALIQLPEVFLSSKMIRFKKDYIRKCNSSYYASKKYSDNSGNRKINKSSIEERMLPKKDFLNKSLEHLKIPYTIDSKQKMKNGKRMTFWQINHNGSQAST